MVDSTRTIRKQGRWFVRMTAEKTGQTEAEAEAAILQLIQRGHVKVLYGEGPRGCDLFEMVIKDRAC